MLNHIPFIKKLIYGNDRSAVSSFYVKTIIFLNSKNNYKTV